MRDFDPDGTRLPVKIDTTSNGEYLPQPLTQAEKHAKALAFDKVADAVKRLGTDRRTFLKSTMGTAATLLALNETATATGAKGGTFNVALDAAEDEALANANVKGDEFIFDIQTHCVDPSGAWRSGMDGILWTIAINFVFEEGARQCGWFDFDCFDAQNMIKEVFLDSDTDVAVLSALWGGRENNPTPIDYAAETRTLVNEVDNRERGLIHGGVFPNEPGWEDFMDELAEEHKVAAWKLYPQWGPDGVGYHMDDPDQAAPFYEKARQLNITTICSHRGLPLPMLDPAYSHPSDIARAAAANPDLTFICYHSGFEPDYPEGAYNPDNSQGIDRLIRAHEENGFRPNEGNLYAEMGGLWREHMTQPEAAAHAMGKLLKTFGPERICWGTDSIWWGSPQDQIETFRTFEITEEFQERFGYPALTKDVKARIFGLNSAEVYGVDPEPFLKEAANDRVEELRRDYAACTNPSFQTYGPKTRRDFWRVSGPAGGRPS